LRKTVAPPNVSACDGGFRLLTLISLARIGHFDLLPKLFERVLISTEVYNEVVVVGAGMPGANQVSHASWIDVVPVWNAAALSLALKETGLGALELSAVLLARELGADLVLLDECKARRYAAVQEMPVIGCIGVLERLFRGGHLSGLREAYIWLLAERVRIDLATLQHSLKKFNLPPL
jgi:predicted nucleic acid-binding protein